MICTLTSFNRASTAWRDGYPGARMLEDETDFTPAKGIAGYLTRGMVLVPVNRRAPGTRRPRRGAPGVFCAPESTALAVTARRDDRLRSPLTPAPDYHGTRDVWPRRRRRFSLSSTTRFTATLCPASRRSCQFPKFVCTDVRNPGTCRIGWAVRANRRQESGCARPVSPEAGNPRIAGWFEGNRARRARDRRSAVPTEPGPTPGRGELVRCGAELRDRLRPVIAGSLPVCAPARSGRLAQPVVGGHSHA